VVLSETVHRILASTLELESITKLDKHQQVIRDLPQLAIFAANSEERPGQKAFIRHFQRAAVGLPKQLACDHGRELSRGGFPGSRQFFKNFEVGLKLSSQSSLEASKIR
jgi:hypothetical protein